jgi:hypothetical protein
MPAIAFAQQFFIGKQFLIQYYSLLYITLLVLSSLKLDQQHNMTNADETTPPEENVDAAASSSDDDDDLGLEGVLERNPDASSSSDESCSSSSEDEKSSDKKRKHEPQGAQTRKKKSKLSTVNVEFTFHDMQGNSVDFFHSLKALLHNSSTVYQQHSSNLTDLMIENVSVGTLISTADDTEGNCYGFASVLNVSTYQESPGIQFLKTICLDKCSADRADELKVVLSGTTKRPAGFLLHGRMVNLPLEITLALHQQLVQDMDWAVEHAGTSFDFGVLVRIAPCQREGAAVVYKFFDDEIMAGRAEYSFQVDAPKSFSKEDKQLLQIIVMTKDGHRAAVKDIEQLVGGT